jgi:hypothetical protein
MLPALWLELNAHTAIWNNWDVADLVCCRKPHGTNFCLFQRKGDVAPTEWVVYTNLGFSVYSQFQLVENHGWIYDFSVFTYWSFRVMSGIVLQCLFCLTVYSLKVLEPLTCVSFLLSLSLSALSHGRGWTAGLPTFSLPRAAWTVPSFLEGRRKKLMPSWTAVFTGEQQL